MALYTRRSSSTAWVKADINGPDHGVAAALEGVVGDGITAVSHSDFVRAVLPGVRVNFVERPEEGLVLDGSGGPISPVYTIAA